MLPLFLPMDTWNTRKTMLIRLQNQYDEHSWEEFVATYRQYIYNVIRRMNLNHHDALEIVQIVLIKLWKKLPDFNYDNYRGKFRNWLYTVTANQVRDFLRSKSVKLSQSEDTISQGEAKLISEPEIEKLAEKEWQIYISNLAWEKVQTQFSESVCQAFLKMIEGVNIADIANEFGITESSVYVYKKRVQDRLQEEIGYLNKQIG